MNYSNAFLLIMCVIFMIGILLFLFVYVGIEALGVLATVPGYNNVTPASTCATCPHNNITPFSATSSILSYYYEFNDFIPFIFIICNLAAIAGAIIFFSDFLSFALGFVFMIVTIFVSFIWSNAMKPIFTSPVFTAVAPHFPAVLNLYAQISTYEVIFLFIYLIVIAAKSRLTGGGGGYGSPAGATL